MARRTLKGTHNIPPFSVVREQDGKISNHELDRLANEVQAISQLLSGGLSLGSGESSFVAGRFKAQFITWVFTTKDIEYIIPHGLGVVPVSVRMCIADRGCSLYDPNFKAGWGASNIQLWCDAAGAKVSFLVEA